MAKSELRSAKEGPSSRLLPRWLALAAIVVGLAGFAGCSTTTLVLGAVGIATDTSVSWEIVKHLHGKLTEGEPVACARLDGIERALNPRCGAFVADSLKGADVGSTRLGECPLTTAARDSRLWPVLPALLAEGARPAACAEAPLVALAQANDCPALGAVPADVQTAFDTLARSDARSVHPDVVRWLSCPNSRAAGACSTIRPAYITITSSAYAAARPRSWLISTRAMPSSAWSSSSSSMIWAWVVTSSAVVASSAMSSRGRQASAIAIMTRCRIPPESWCGYSPRRRSGSGMRTDWRRLNASSSA